MAENEKYVDGLTEAESEDMAIIVNKTINEICLFSDKHNIDRDSMLKYFADMLTALTEVASIQNYETNHTCNCKHNSNSRDNEPCCRCDSRQTNADRIRNMSDEELAEFIEQISTDSMETISFGTKEYKEIWERKETALEWLQSEAE